ncbi:MAG: hypothetical protein HKO09_05570 [Croceitalea sp.]|nr:hypothetical protein [Croceitalea sp.]
MKLTFKIFGIVLILIGITIMIKPQLIFEWLENNLESKSLYFTAILVRLVIGVLFIVAAKQSIYPTIIRIIGYVALLAAIIFIFIGHAKFEHFIGYILHEFKDYASFSAIIVLLFGGFLFYAFSKKN